ncbi:unnamed protein product [Spirodela intermedia]|uniref:Uncharacterized protein n=1 Tax=Spirodela intermedia TaxID=51605 RepID=A0ABN7EB72_SPIIN|nr:unnamed protein product [Spirodela intermedia]
MGGDRSSDQLTRTRTRGCRRAGRGRDGRRRGRRAGHGGARPRR